MFWEEIPGSVGKEAFSISWQLIARDIEQAMCRAEMTMFFDLF